MPKIVKINIHMKLRKLLLIAAFGVLALPGAWARQLTVGEAIAAAGAATGSFRAHGEATAAYTLRADDINTVYVVNGSEGGFMVLAADDVAPALLGFSDSSMFDPGNMPPQMESWLKEYSRQIAVAAANGGRVLAAPADPSLTDIAPITRTKWNQDAPYNDLCPRVGTTPTYTGCVATAVAQVMKSYNHPAKGTGTYSYVWNNKRLSFDYDATTFEWDLMSDIYDGKQSAAQNNAVATLMYAVGIASDMSYGTGGSGAQGIAAAMGLARNLGYDRSLTYRGRDFYTLPVWCRMLHQELSQGHPLYYDGANASVGHAFVIDGYRASDGLFHLNWGWGGISDGYFAITTLDPDNQGIGGSTEGYAIGQSAIFGLKPDQGTTEYTPVLQCYSIAPEAEQTVSRNDETVILGGYNEGVYSFSIGNVTVEIGLKLTDASGTESYVWAPYGEIEFAPYTGFRTWEIPAELFPEQGSYSAVPVCRRGTEIFAIPTPVGEPSQLAATCSAGSVTVALAGETCELSIADAEVLSPFYRNRQVMIGATVANARSEYYGTVSASVTTSNGRVYKLGNALVDIIAGDSQEIIIKGALPFTIPLGEADLRFYDDSTDEPIGDAVKVQIEAAPQGELAIAIDNIDVPGATSGDGSAANPFVVDASTLAVNATMNCTSGYFTSVVRLYFFSASGTSSNVSLQAPLFYLGAGQNRMMHFSGNLSSALQKGQVYATQFYSIEGRNVSVIENAPELYFKIADISGVENIAETTFGIYPNPATDMAKVTAPAGIATVDIYNLTGAKVAAMGFAGTETTVEAHIEGLAAGHYIMQVATADGRTSTMRLIKL